MQENVDQKKSEHGNFSHSGFFQLKIHNKYNVCSGLIVTAWHRSFKDLVSNIEEGQTRIFTFLTKAIPSIIPHEDFGI